MFQESLKNAVTEIFIEFFTKEIFFEIKQTIFLDFFVILVVPFYYEEN